MARVTVHSSTDDELKREENGQKWKKNGENDRERKKVRAWNEENGEGKNRWVMGLLGLIQIFFKNKIKLWALTFFYPC